MSGEMAWGAERAAGAQESLEGWPEDILFLTPELWPCLSPSAKPASPRARHFGKKSRQRGGLHSGLSRVPTELRLGHQPTFM